MSTKNTSNQQQTDSIAFDDLLTTAIAQFTVWLLEDTDCVHSVAQRFIY